MRLRYRSIISYADIIKREDIMLQRGMNFRVKPHYSIILMSARKGAPYRDRWYHDTGLLEYEGHDQPKRGSDDPKRVDQPMKHGGGNLTENGKFYEAALSYKQKKSKPEVVQVYEKISQGVWCDRGRFELIDAKIVFDGIRNVFKFFLRPSRTPNAREPFLRQTRVIPTAVKVEVWKRDQGQCVICGSKENLHFDHDVPYSKGGSSITAKNVRILCAKHNIAKSNKIMDLLPWITSFTSALFLRAS